MIRHNLPGFLAGPMPVPGWPKEEKTWEETVIEKIGLDIPKSVQDEILRKTYDSFGEIRDRLPI